MPSPFPGMDPFLEHPAYFGSLHTRLMVEITNELQPKLPDPYFAEVDERLWVETSRRPIEPDVDVIHKRGAPRKRANGRAALAVRSKPIVVTMFEDEKRQCFVDIRTRQGDEERVVATIEVLSPTNKTPGEKGQEAYLKKQQEVIDGGSIHLVEIDLLRGGHHVTVIKEDVLQEEAGPFDYHVCVRPFDEPGKFYVYPIELPDPLPEIAVPLLPGDGTVPLDLQAVFNRCYEAGPYRKRVRYTLDRVEPPLPRKRLAWAKQILRTKITEHTE
jgi:hypothetical protein